MPGLAIALLENNQMRYLHSYGYGNSAIKAPMELQTAIGDSFSKTMFA